MVRKILRVGTSAAVTISKKALSKVGLRIGQKVDVSYDALAHRILIEPVKKAPGVDPEIARLALSFMRRYRPALEELARR